MNKRKKTIRIFVLAIGLVAVISLVAMIIYKEWKKREEQYQYKLEVLYQREARAFAMDDRYDCYMGFSYVDVNSLIINLASYKHFIYKRFEIEVEISVEDIKEFLSSEYDENGELYVLNPPENIDKYIQWFTYGGLELTNRYYMYLCNFQDANSEKYSRKSVYILDEAILYELIYDFENCPNREDYEHY